MAPTTRSQSIVATRPLLPKPGRPPTTKGRLCQRCVRGYQSNPRGAFPCTRTLGKMKCGLCTTARHACIIVPKSLTQTSKNLEYMARKLREGQPGFNEAMVTNAAKSLSDRMKVKAKEAGKDKPHSLEPVLQNLLHSVRHLGTLYAQAHDLDLPDWESDDEDEDETSEAGGESAPGEATE